jgi:hypothetical protein
MNLPLPCIRCDKELEPAMQPLPDDKEINQPFAGTAFTSSGHYGSTVFDPVGNMMGRNGTFIELNVCDDCLTKLASQKKVVLVRTSTKTETTLSPWDPKEEV